MTARMKIGGAIAIVACLKAALVAWTCQWPKCDMCWSRPWWVPDNVARYCVVDIDQFPDWSVYGVASAARTAPAIDCESLLSRTRLRAAATGSAVRTFATGPAAPEPSSTSEEVPAWYRYHDCAGLLWDESPRIHAEVCCMERSVWYSEYKE